MPVTAKFVADFREFEDAVHRATNVILRDFQSGIGRVDKDLKRFGDEFSGVRVIQNAQLMVEAVNRIGGTSKLTESELARVEAVVTNATDKMKRLGLEVPPALATITRETAAMKKAFEQMDAARPFVRVSEGVGPATNALGVFAGGLSQVDRTLAQFGVNLTPQIAALNEMALVAGRSAAQLGLVAAGGAVLATAIGAWKLGRMAADFFDLDGKVADLSARLLGFGNVAGETAAAKMDTLAKASTIAGYEITVMTDAVRIINEEAKRLGEALHSPEANFQRVRAEVAAAQREYRGLSEATRLQIDSLLEWGRSADEIAKILNVKSETVSVLIERQKLKAEQDKVNTRIADERAAAEKRLADSVKQVMDAHDKAVSSLANRLFGLEDIERARQYIEALGGVENVSRLSASAQQDVARAMEAGLDAMLRAGAGTEDLTSKMEAFRLAATQSARDAAAAFQAIQAEAAAAAAAVAAAAQGLTIIGQAPASPFGPRESGVTVFGGQVSGSTADFSSALDRAFIRSNVGLGGGPSAFTGGYAGVTINVDARESMYDTPASLERLADRVSESVMQRLLGLGYTVR